MGCSQLEWLVKNLGQSCVQAKQKIIWEFMDFGKILEFIEVGLRKWGVWLDFSFQINERLHMRKRRTREHIVADLGYNHFEKHVLLAGHVLTKITSDYGYDGLVNTFDSNGEIEHNFFLMQVKSTENIRFSPKHNGFEINLSKRDLSHWLFNPIVVVVVLFDLKEEIAYYLHIQDYIYKNKLDYDSINKFIQVYLPAQNVLTFYAVNYFRSAKNP